jgi:hypothetical protein
MIGGRLSIILLQPSFCQSYLFQKTPPSDLLEGNINADHGGFLERARRRRNQDKPHGRSIADCRSPIADRRLRIADAGLP